MCSLKNTYARCGVKIYARACKLVVFCATGVRVHASFLFPSKCAGKSNIFTKFACTNRRIGENA